MKTDDLIDALAKDLEPAKRANPLRRIVIAVGLGLTAALGLMIAFLNIRPDIGVALAPVLMKAAFSAFAASLAAPLALRLATPGRPLGWRLAGLSAFGAIAILVGVVALLGEAPEKRLLALTGGSFPWCLALIPLLAMPAAVALTMAWRALAPTKLPLTGAAIGALSGGIGAIAYAMYCPVDSIAFVTIWYALAIGLCAGAGAILGARFLRW